MTIAGAPLAHDHEGCGLLGIAFVTIGTAAAAADGVEIQIRQEAVGFFGLTAERKTFSQPGGEPMGMGPKSSGLTYLLDQVFVPPSGSLGRLVNDRLAHFFELGNNGVRHLPGAHRRGIIPTRLEVIRHILAFPDNFRRGLFQLIGFFIFFEMPQHHYRG